LASKIIKGDKGDYSVLKELMLGDSLNVVLASRACALLGNLMKHKSDFSLVLKSHPSLVDSILRCLQNEDSNVRKSAVYVTGNAVFHTQELYSLISSAIPHLVNLLKDTFAKTRANAAAALGNLCRHSGVLANPC